MISNSLVVPRSNKNGASAVQIFMFTFSSDFAFPVLRRCSHGHNFRTRISYLTRHPAYIHTHAYTYIHIYVSGAFPETLCFIKFCYFCKRRRMKSIQQTITNKETHVLHPNEFRTKYSQNKML